MQNSFSVGLFVLLLSSALVFSGCTSTATPSEELAPGVSTEKSGDNELTGTIVKNGDKYYIKPSGQPQQEVDSYNIDLSSFENQTVTITGQYSGTTLFAGKVDAQ